MKRRLVMSVSLVGLSVVFFAVGALAVVDRTDAPSRDASDAQAAGGRRVDIPALQARLRDVPGDGAAWATLGMAYLDRARSAGDPAFYPKAEGALRKSLSVQREDNFVADAGMAALANARHDFEGGRRWAKRGLAINGASAVLYGALADAETQLGHYADAAAATQRMLDLSPDTSALSRASYVWELRGDLARAEDLMTRAHAVAADASQRAATQYYLGEIALSRGDFPAALAHFDAGLVDDERFAPLYDGRAKAEQALGRPADAAKDLATAAGRVPQPGYVLAYGELLDSLGRSADAAAQYDLFRVEQRLFEANGVTVDVEPVLFEADHGDPPRAVALAEKGLRTRQFIDMQDAYAWALYRDGRFGEAKAASDRALALGTRNALFEFHAGMIDVASGDRDGARRHLASALDMNPAFSPIHAPTARAELDRLG